MTGDRLGPLAWAVALTLVLASLAAVVRTPGTWSPGVVVPAAAAVAATDPAHGDGEAEAQLGRESEDQLPLSDPQPLDLSAAGYDLPPGASVYAARVVAGGDRPRYLDYVAGGGALAEDFWPASSIKVLAALGALDFASSLGFTGAATVSFETGYTATLREIYDSAIVDSDNFDYDVLILVAGFDRLNADFLSPAHGFPNTVIQRSYSGIDVRWSPEMTLEEDGRTTVVPGREGVGDYGCPDEGNCSDLFEMSEAVRRLVLDASIPPEERFAISPVDVDALTTALSGTGSFFAPGVESALGPGATVQGKPGVAAGLACVDAAVVTAPAGDRYLLSAAIPDDDSGDDPGEECQGLSDLAAAVLPLLAGH
ncbi:MAG: hypothetical protein QOI99_276 [Actinomycetota bacterium]|nr:hypothetical protein [Actinomycetota bacterium]